MWQFDKRTIHKHGNVNTNKKSAIYALQRSELLDEGTCNFCLSMDGMIVSLDEEVELPPIINAPEELRKLLRGDPNGLIKMDKPIIRENSIAWDYIHKQGYYKIVV